MHSMTCQRHTCSTFKQIFNPESLSGGVEINVTAVRNFSFCDIRKHDGKIFVWPGRVPIT
jgi:hypothetical protein